MTTIAFAQWHMGRAILRAARRRLPRAGATAVAWGLAACAIFLIAGFLFSISTIGGYAPLRLGGWIGGAAQFYSFGSTGGFLLYWLLKWLTGRVRTSDFDPARRRLINAAAGAAVAAPFAALGFGTFIQRTNFRVAEVEAPIADLPADLESLRLVQLSDIHLSPFLSESEFARFVDAANELRGHVGLVTGDLISMRGDPLDACLRQLARFRVESAALGCMGNHEIYAKSERYTTERAARFGLRFLRNAATQLRFGNATVNFVGTDYLSVGERRRYLTGMEKLVAPGVPNILLSHNPDVFPVAAAKGFDLTVSGHTHGGQVSVEILHQSFNLARFFTPFVYGMYRRGRSSIYVTRGIGTIGLPARIGAPPEIALIRLRKA